MGKRKRGEDSSNAETADDAQPLKKQTVIGSPLANNDSNSSQSVSFQIITGSYDRVLHGIIATVPIQGPPEGQAHFQDNFIFNAHASAIRCLALSPSDSEYGSESRKIVLATGGTDERINLYSISTSLPTGPSLPTLSSVPSLENPQNKEIGILLHHSSTVNVLHFPTRSKLISGSDDNTIAISRTRDWTVLSTVKAPKPKVQGRPSGDTAPLGGTPAGINDFAVHPSMKLMISVGKGEKCMRLWNLVTGKKANVLNFEKDLLQSVGEAKWSRGEGQKVVWNAAGDEFAVAFERGVAIFGMDSEVKCIAVPKPASKVHQITYVSTGSGDLPDLLAISTEDGRILIYSTEVQVSQSNGSTAQEDTPIATAIAYLGGKEAGVASRIKDFQVISPSSEFDPGTKIIITAGSDGTVMVWQTTDRELHKVPLASKANGTTTNGTTKKVTSESGSEVKHIGNLLGKYDTGNRITCMKAFQLQGSLDGLIDDFEEQDLESSDEGESNEDNETTDGEAEFEGFE